MKAGQTLDQAQNHYSLAFPLEWRSRAASGSGTTSQISSSEVLFTADQPIRPGEKVVLSIAWPVLLGHVRLQLIVNGTVSSSEGTEVYTHVSKYAFRTRGSRDPRHNEEAIPIAPVVTPVSITNARPTRPLRASTPVPDADVRCKCGRCRLCLDAHWNDVFSEKFADPDYYNSRQARLGSSLGGSKR